jgi:thioredoxin-like negative regulator of GroEL
MPLRRLLLFLAFALGFAAAHAAEKQPFTKEAFAAAQAAGESIVVHINAPWCPTCRAQEPILDKLTAEPKFGAAKYFSVDFDSQRDAVRGFKATSQSAIIVFKGGKETGRSVGETDASRIGALLDKAL